MRAMVLEEIGKPLVLKELPIPEPQAAELLIKVFACGVCRTDLHIVDGELPHPHLPLILGHQVVGQVVKSGTNGSLYPAGTLVGVPWLGGCCVQCEFCLSNRENLCNQAVFTGYHRNGGYAEYCVADEHFVLPLTGDKDPVHTAPLLCAGLIGFRAYRLAGPCETIGLYGFGSSAHLLIQVAKAQGKRVYVFTRPGDAHTQAFAKRLGATWAGGSDEQPPEPLDAALLFAPVGALYVEALKAVKKGGRVVSAGIHMSDIPSFPYRLLWEERSISSVANLTRQDGRDFFEMVKKVPLNVSVKVFPLEEANQALAAIKQGKVEGSVVLRI